MEQSPQPSAQPPHVSAPSGPAYQTPQTVSPRPSRPRRKRFAIIILTIVLSIAGAAGATWVTYTILSNNDGNSTSITQTDGNELKSQDEEVIASVAEKVGPSVVSIITTTQAQSVRGVYEGTGAGTGVVVSEDGYVMTNNHVIEGARAVSVVMSDGTTYDDVTVIGSDPLNDIGFLKINGADKLTPATLGDSSSLRIGQRVIAIGNALGQFQNTVTSGIISGTGRPITAGSASGETETLTDLIQTDAAINSGNSGGPLVNVAGQVIGINTAVANDANGIGFAIPINATKGVLSGVLKNGKVARAYLGVRFVDLTPAIAKQEGVSVNRGAYIVNNSNSPITASSPAGKAGIKDGDVITKVNDATVGEAGSMSSLIAQYRPGDSVTLTILRDGRTSTAEVILSEY